MIYTKHVTSKGYVIYKKYLKLKKRFDNVYFWLYTVIIEVQ